AGRRVQLAQPLLGQLRPAERLQVVLVEERVEILRRVVPEVHVDGLAVDLVADTAPAAVEVVLPFRHSRYRATLRNSFRMAETPEGGEVGQGSSQPGAHQLGNPELTCTVPDEANQSPRLPWGR